MFCWFDPETGGLVTLAVTEANLLLSGAQATETIWENVVVLPWLEVPFVATLPKVATSCPVATFQIWISALLSARYLPLGDQASPSIIPSKVLVRSEERR